MIHLHPLPFQMHLLQRPLRNTEIFFRGREIETHPEQFHLRNPTALRQAFHSVNQLATGLGVSLAE